MIKGIKKVISSIIVLIVLFFVVFISASAVTYPENESGRNYFCYWQRDASTQMFAWSDSEFYVANGELLCETGCTFAYYMSTDSGVSWIKLGENAVTLNSELIEIYAANYVVGDFTPLSATITSPIDGVDYDWETIPEIEFTYTGDSEEYELWIENTDYNESYRIYNERIVFDETTNTAYLPAEYTIWPESNIRVYLTSVGTDLNEVTVLDYIDFELTESLPETYLLGVEDGGVYNTMPVVVLYKHNYYPMVYVTIETYNDEETVYAEFISHPDLNIVLDTDDFYVLGDNVLRLYEYTTTGSELIAEYSFYLTTLNETYSGSEDTDGDGSIDSWDEIGDEPTKPGEDATIIDWIKYIAEIISYVFELGFTAIKQFAENIASLLSSLFSMISPVISFVQILFASLPSVMATGIYAVFALSCVLVMIRMVRR